MGNYAFAINNKCLMDCKEKCQFICSLDSSTHITFGIDFRDYIILEEIHKFRIHELKQIRSSMMRLKRHSESFYKNVSEQKREGWWGVYQAIDRNTWQSIRIIRWKDSRGMDFNVFFLPNSIDPIASIFESKH